MTHRLADELVARGVASADTVSTWLRARHGESFAVWLVRNGHVSSEVVAAACAAAWELPRASPEQLASMRPAVFQRIPAEIVHDAGLLPLALDASHRLLVGVVDPAEQRAIEEAEFFAGVALELSVISLEEMAEGFEVMSGRPWRVRTDELPQQPRGSHRAAGQARSSAEPGRFEVLPSDAEVDFELTPSQRKGVGRAEQLDSSELIAVESDSATEAQHEAADDSGSTTAGPWSREQQDSGSGWSEPGANDPIVEGLPQSGGAARTDTETPVNPAPTQLRAADRRRAMSTGAVVIPSALASATIPSDGVLGSTSVVVQELGDPDPAAEAAFRAAIRGVREATSRDDIARQLVDALSLVFPSTMVLSLRHPELVIRDASLRWGTPRTIGTRFETVAGGLWDRVVSSGVAYLGPLPAGDPLRRIVLSSCGDQALLLPIVLNRRPVTVIVLMADAGDALPGVGESADALCRAVAQAYKRAILRTKREPQSV